MIAHQGTPPDGHIGQYDTFCTTKKELVLSQAWGGGHRKFLSGACLWPMGGSNRLDGKRGLWPQAWEPRAWRDRKFRSGICLRPMEGGSLFDGKRALWPRSRLGLSQGRCSMVPLIGSTHETDDQTFWRSCAGPRAPNTRFRCQSGIVILA